MLRWHSVGVLTSWRSLSDGRGGGNRLPDASKGANPPFCRERVSSRVKHGQKCATKSHVVMLSKNSESGCNQQVKFKDWVALRCSGQAAFPAGSLIG